MSIILEIKRPRENSKEKFIDAMYELSKAMKVPFQLEHVDHSEPTPYKALRQHADEVSEIVQEGLLRIWKLVLKHWLKGKVEKAKSDDQVYKVDGKIFINPRTGKHLTVKEWDVIKKDLSRMFSHLYGPTQEALTIQAVAMGKILQQMEPDNRLTVDKSKLDIPLHTEVIDRDSAYNDILTWGDVHTGELIQNVTDRSRRAIVSTIMRGYQENFTSRQMQQELFEQFSTLNRDWRRIAEQETASNFNNGYLISETKNSPDTDHIFMIGISGAGACEWCASQVNEKVVVALESAPPGGDIVTIDGKEYTAIWPGKSNFGRKRANWWVASGTQHPHCRCTWTRYYPEMEGYMKKLKEAIGSTDS